MNSASNSGALILVSAPSGAGKTSLVAALLEHTEDLCLSISHTTRTRRPQEVDGHNYHFISQQSFNRMRDTGQFLEDAVVFGNHYATSRDAVCQKLEAGQDVILEIDWQGAEQIRENFDNSISIFILPPSRSALRERLKARGQDNADVINGRMDNAIAEMSHYVDYDYLVINDDFDQVLAEMRCIVRALRLRRPFKTAQNQQLIADLLSTALES
jgi:guanylate kinase